MIPRLLTHHVEFGVSIATAVYNQKADICLIRASNIMPVDARSFRIIRVPSSMQTLGSAAYCISLRIGAK